MTLISNSFFSTGIFAAASFSGSFCSELVTLSGDTSNVLVPTPSSQLQRHLDGTAHLCFNSSGDDSGAESAATPRERLVALIQAAYVDGKFDPDTNPMDFSGFDFKGLRHACGPKVLQAIAKDHPRAFIGANLAGAALSGFDLSGLYFKRALLAGAVLIRANLAGADLAGANLVGAHLTGANLAGADLAGANLAGADLAGANLAGAYLSGAKLNGAHLTGANLAGADLSGSNLVGAHLTGANLAGADLAGANLAGAVLRGANVLHVDWRAAVINAVTKMDPAAREAALAGGAIEKD